MRKHRLYYSPPNSFFAFLLYCFLHISEKGYSYGSAVHRPYF